MTANEKIQEIRKKKGVSISDLAKEIGYTRVGLTKSLRQADMKLNMLIKVAQALRVSPYVLLNAHLDPTHDSVISGLTDEQQFHITLISRLASELVEEKIITPHQKGLITKYLLSKSK